MINLEIAEGFRSAIDSSLIEDAALTTLRHQSAREDSEMTIVITYAEQLHSLNHQFLDIDTPTDVLSFPADFTDPENEAHYMGDILISFPRAESQAAFRGHDIMSELQLLIVHGVLHILGHDHAISSEKAAMWAAQREILHQLGLESLKIQESE